MTYTEKHRAAGRAAFLMGEARDAKHGVKTALYVHAYAEKVQAAYDAGYAGMTGGLGTNHRSRSECDDVTDSSPASSPTYKEDLFA